MGDGTYYVRPKKSNCYECVVGKASENPLWEEEFINKISASDDVLFGYVRDGEF